MKKIRNILLFLLLAAVCATFAAADALVGPALPLVLAVEYWYVILLVILLIVVTILLIKKLKNKGD